MENSCALSKVNYAYDVVTGLKLKGFFQGGGEEDIHSEDGKALCYPPKDISNSNNCKGRRLGAIEVEVLMEQNEG